MPEHKLTWFEGGDRPVSGTVYVRPDPDEQHVRDVLGDIGDSYIPDPVQRADFVRCVMDVLYDPGFRRSLELGVLVGVGAPTADAVARDGATTEDEWVDREARRLRAAEYGGGDAGEWDLLSEHVQASWRDEARETAANVIEIPLPPEPDRSRRLEAYDPETGETRFWWDWDARSCTWERRQIGVGWGHLDVMQACHNGGWRLRSVPRPDGSDQGG